MSVDPPTGDELRAATDPDTLLPGEDPESTRLDDARHWVAVYSELLEMKRSLLELTEEITQRMSHEARNDAAFDERLLRAQAERYRVRHEYWSARVVDLGPARGAALAETAGPGEG